MEQVKIALVGEAWGEVFLTRGYIALVDLEDLERISAHKWYALVREGTVHAARKNKLNGTIFMHHEVLNIRGPKGFHIDHVNRNGIDNRKINLRKASYRQNALNSKRSDEASLIEKHGNRFRVRPWINGKRTVIGSFLSFNEAAEAVRKYREQL